MVSKTLIYALSARNKGFQIVISHVLQKFKMADSASTLSEARACGIQINKTFFVSDNTHK